MKRSLLILFICSYYNCYAQTQSKIKQESAFNIESFAEINGFTDACPYTIEKAKRAIKQNSLTYVISIVFLGGSNLNSDMCKYFEAMYNVRFDYLGCTRTWDITNEDVKGYNQEIMDHLIKIHGERVKEDLKLIYVKN